MPLVLGMTAGFVALTLALGIALAIAVGGAWWMMARWTPGKGRPGIEAAAAG